ncbi:MAG TPA: hypothetical protein PKE47_03625, partial [Verrucomicrobiota bacterium]|nr:hypothetical protein [Verrucomicrobiota bacterium]
WRRPSGVSSSYFIHAPRIVGGVPAAGGAAIAEFAEVLTATTDGIGRVTLTLKAALANSYARDSVVIFGNVAKATHGATKHEGLGAGDARFAERAEQRVKRTTGRGPCCSATA